MKWSETVMNPFGGPIVRALDGTLFQVGRVTRVRSQFRGFGFHNIVSLSIYSPDGKKLVSSRTSPLAEWNKLSKSFERVRME